MICLYGWSALCCWILFGGTCILMVWWHSMHTLNIYLTNVVFFASGLYFVIVHMLIHCVLLGFMLVYMAQQCEIANDFITKFLTRVSCFKYLIFQHTRQFSYHFFSKWQKYFLSNGYIYDQKKPRRYRVLLLIAFCLQNQKKIHQKLCLEFWL